MSNPDNPWLETETGWVAFASDLQLGMGKDARTPQGEPINLSDGNWQKQRDCDGDLLEWRRVLPDGKRLTIFND